MKTRFNSDERRAAADGFISAMDDAGYVVTEGYLSFFTIDDCEFFSSQSDGAGCMGNNPVNPYGIYMVPTVDGGIYASQSDGAGCMGNNPVNPYGIYMVPTVDGEYMEDLPYLMRDDEKLYLTHRYGVDEATIYFGRTPPPAEYLGFTTYLGNRYVDGENLVIGASLSDTLNPTNIKVDSDGSYDDAFDKDVVVVNAGVESTYLAIQDAFAASNVSEDIMNLQVVSPDVFQYGLERDADTYNFLHRAHLYKNLTEQEERQSSPPVLIFRVTPKVSNPQLNYYPRPDRFDRKDKREDFAADLNTLENAIRESYDDYTVIRNNSSFPFLFFGEDCIDDDENCNGDNADTVYIGNFQWELLTETNFYVVFGANHAKTNMAKYCNVAVLNPAERTSIGEFNSINDMEGSAQEYVEDLDHLYVMHVRRNCTGHNFCFEVSYESPAGLSAGTAPGFIERAYLKPGTTAGPHPLDLALFRVVFVNTEKTKISIKIKIKNAVTSFLIGIRNRAVEEIKKRYPFYHPPLTIF
eukprot:CAMPEP_0194399622 /NCGR_PEP_ID=MMETSP0174-20130528/126760_1 /TAXON_ID=216777 /ORGANISM="Proboscia alata, Strain PI-D3" /LENGTH=522 /DNA_ID=CAMNT_0039196047 /DNA_START=264 /DNA_END=1831 /DNA_ORIENTATION=-